MLVPCSSLFRQVGSVRLEVVPTPTNVTQPATTADEVDYVYTVTNNGLLTLYNIAIQTDDLVELVCVNGSGGEVVGTSLGIAEGLASYPSTGLAPAGSLACSTTSRVSQEEVSRQYRCYGLNARWRSFELQRVSTKSCGSCKKAVVCSFQDSSTPSYCPRRTALMLNGRRSTPG